MANKDGFLTVTNLLQCIGVFKEYMNKAYSLNIDQLMDEQRLKETFYTEMVSVSEKPELNGRSLKELNNHTMNIVKANILRMKASTKPNPQVLEREQQVYGHRAPVVSDALPTMENVSKRGTDLSREFESMVQLRNDEQKTTVPTPELGKQINESAISEQDFQKKLKEMEANRDIDQRIQARQQVTVNKPHHEHNPKDLYTSLISKEPRSGPILPKPSRADEFVIPAPKIRLADMYISINGADRDWKTQSHRYQYVVDFSAHKENAISNTPRDIESIKVSFVVLPAEIIEPRTSKFFPKTQFQHEFSFAYPYIIMRIDEINNAYDGTNNEVRNCFCKLIFDKTYKMPNGRGYMVLKPMQDEKKTFYPNRLASLQQMSISLVKPNGTLFNNSTDDYRVFKLEYEPFNPMYLKVVLDKYFDKNEFFVGDHVSVRGIKLGDARDSASSRLIDFINRHEGHDVLELGQANESGYHNSFYILTPGELDQKAGKLIEDKDVLKALQDYNQTIDWRTQTVSMGDVINVSLQNVIAMKFTVNIQDASAIIGP